MGIRITGWRVLTNSVWVASKPGCFAVRLLAWKCPSLDIAWQNRLLHASPAMRWPPRTGRLCCRMRAPSTCAGDASVMDNRHVTARRPWVKYTSGPLCRLSNRIRPGPAWSSTRNSGLPIQHVDSLAATARELIVKHAAPPPATARARSPCALRRTRGGPSG